MVGKYAAILGPVLVGGVKLLTGSARFGIASILVLFVAGGVLLSRVREDEARRAAREDEPVPVGH
jgi:UMF1 family MFS transporter